MTLGDINRHRLMSTDCSDVLLLLFFHLFSALQHMGGGAEDVCCFFSYLSPLPGSWP